MMMLMMLLLCAGACDSIRFRLGRALPYEAYPGGLDDFGAIAVGRALPYEAYTGGLDDADFLVGLKVDPIPSDPVGAKNGKDDDEAGRNTSRGFTPRWSHKKTPS